MDSYGTEGGPSRSESRERRSESQHSRNKSRRDSKNKTGNASRGGTNWQRNENAQRTYTSDIRQKSSSVRAEGIHFNNKRQNKSVKAECFVNLVYEDDRTNRRERQLPKSTSLKKSCSSHTRRAIYTTEKYMQANCQFVVHSESSAITTKLKEDPDYAPPWESIAEVRLIASSEPNCPICIHKSVASRITTCGHLFCLPCILHYFTVKEEKAVPCPICFAKIDVSSIKPVSLIHCIDYSIGDSLTLVLSKCRKGTTLVEQVEVDSCLPRMSNVVFASKREQILRLESDRNKLKKRLSDSTEPEETCFVIEAMKMLEGEICHLEVNEEAYNSSVELLGVSPTRPDNIVYYVDALMDQKAAEGRGTEVSSTELPTKDVIPSPMEAAKSVTDVPSGNSREIDNSYVYFYQSMDGQRIYLNSFNVRCLQKQFGHLSQCPPVIEGKVVAIEYVSVTSDVRSQFRYLSHLPLYSHFQSAEIDLVGVLSKEVYQQFSADFERRKAERIQKQNKEDAYSRRAESFMERVNVKASGVLPISLDEPLVYDHAAFLADSPSLHSNSTPVENSMGIETGTSDSPNAWAQSTRRLIGAKTMDQEFPTLGSPPSFPPSPAASMMASTSRTLSWVTNQNRTTIELNSKVKLAPRPGVTSPTAVEPAPKPQRELTAEEEEELIYAAPEQPRTLADCLSNFNLKESQAVGNGRKKSKKKNEARLLFSSGRGHALLN